jgi:predicted phosphodiesterase
VLLQYASDLHLETPGNLEYVLDGGLAVKGDVLVLAGDLVSLAHPQRIDPFWDWCSKHFRETYAVPGNHEFYETDAAVYGARWMWLLRHNVRYAQNQVVRIGDADLILSTLWSRINPLWETACLDYVNDFSCIKWQGHLLEAREFNAMHEACLTFLKEALAASKAEKRVVVTHHVPTAHAVSERYRGSALESAFVAELGEWIAGSGADTWIFGHSHANMNVRIGTTDIVCNQLGSTVKRKASGWRPDAVIEI